MRVISPSWYAERRLLAFSCDVLQETVGQLSVTERVLQLVWHHQRLVRDKLETVDHQPVLVLHPGFWNREAGPDFHGAVLRFGTSAAKTGDVEIDIEAYGWHAHRHDLNPAYKNVILHVVWDCGPNTTTPVPTLCLKPFLDAPLEELKRWLGRNPRFCEPLKGQCCAPLKELPPSLMAELLRQAALIRLQAKATEFEARARQVGWEWTLWEGIFGALGYKHNVWPMRRMGELLPSVLDGPHSGSVVSLQAILFGLSGLLPGELPINRPTVQRYFCALWDVWWRFRETYLDLILPRGCWRLNGIRPANHPSRRLALAAHWLASGDLLPKLERWFSGTAPAGGFLRSLLQVFQVNADEFWSWHWTLTSPLLRKPQPLIGPQRVTDLAMNVVLPWFWMRAAAGKNKALQQEAEERYFAWPRSEDNAILRLARQRMLGGKEKAFLKTAAAQQGLLQIVHDFCDHSNALCENCKFPELIRDLE